MIRPTKYMDLETCVLQVAYVILADLRQSHAVDVAGMEDRAVAATGEVARVHILSALGMLFCTGIVDYDEETDAVYLTAASLRTP